MSCRLERSVPAQTLLDVVLWCPVVPDGGTWTLETRKARGGGDAVMTLMLVLEKADRGSFWKCLCEGHSCVKMPAEWPLVGV